MLAQNDLGSGNPHTLQSSYSYISKILFTAVYGIELANDKSII